MEFHPSRLQIPSSFNHTTRPLAPRSSQTLTPPTNNDENQTEMFRFRGDGCIEWAPGAEFLGDIYSICNISTSSTSELDAGTDWVRNYETNIVPLSPSQLSTSYFDVLPNQWIYDHSQSSPLSDLDLDAAAAATAAAETSRSQKARRRAQNREAQRAYRARKDNELARCKLHITELENEIERVREMLNSGSVAALQDRIMILETENRTLQRKAVELKGFLHRVAQAMMGCGMDGLLSEVIECSRF